MGTVCEGELAKSYHLHIRATDSGFTLGRAGGGTFCSKERIDKANSMDAESGHGGCPTTPLPSPCGRG